MESDRLIAITGVGLVTPLGESAGQTWENLLAGQCIADHARVPGLTTKNRCVELACQVASEAPGHANWPADKCSDPETALLVGTSKGNIEPWIETSRIAVDGIAETALAVGESTGIGGGIRLTYSAACASGLHAMGRAMMALRTGEARRALVVAAEASVHPLFIESFKRLGVIPPPGHGCRPFDLNRKGFLMSEAAAAVCLEFSDESNSPNLVLADDFVMGSDAASLTGADPHGRTLRRIIRRLIGERGVDLIHAHGTATESNDPVELAAIEHGVAAQKNPPAIYSHKGALGHSLGASGLVSVVISTCCHRTGMVPPNVRTTEPLATPLRLNRGVWEGRIHRSIVLATGFGGPAAGISLV